MLSIFSCAFGMKQQVFNVSWDSLLLEEDAIKDFQN